MPWLADLIKEKAFEKFRFRPRFLSNYIGPFVPLMKNGLQYIDKLEKEIYNSRISRPERSDLLTIFTMFTGLVDKSLATDLLKRRRDIMVESPVY